MPRPKKIGDEVVFPEDKEPRYRLSDNLYEIVLNNGILLIGYDGDNQDWMVGYRGNA